MNSENKDWKPEVGKTAWTKADIETIIEVMVLSPYGQVQNYFAVKGKGWQSNRHIKDLFPTPEAALQSIKVYDLEGKEVVIPRARVDLPDHTQSLSDMANEHIEAIKRNDQAMLEAYKGQREKDVLFQESMKTILDHTHLLNGIDKCHECGAPTKRYYQVLCAGEKELYQCQKCGYVDGISKFCSDCGVRFAGKPIEDPGKIAKLEYSTDMSYKPNEDRRLDGGC